MALIKIKLEELEKTFASKPVIVVTEKVSTNNTHLAKLCMIVMPVSPPL